MPKQLNIEDFLAKSPSPTKVAADPFMQTFGHEIASRVAQPIIQTGNAVLDAGKSIGRSISSAVTDPFMQNFGQEIANRVVQPVIRTGNNVMDVGKTVGGSVGSAATSAAGAVRSALRPPVEGFGALDRETAKQIADNIQTEVTNPLAGKVYAKNLMLGGALGATAVALRAYLRQIRSSMSPTRGTYTQPTAVSVYAVEDEPTQPKRRRRRKTANILPGVLGFGSDPASQLVAQDPTAMAIATAALVGGIPLGYMATNKLMKNVGSVARQKELEAARAEYEAALRESAARRAGKKIASTVDPQIAKLADNCEKLAFMDWIVPKSIQPYILLSLAMSPLAGAYYGYRDRRSKSSAPLLDYAERKIQIDRENTNPTFPLATLQNVSNEEELVDDSDEPGYDYDYID